MKTPPCITSIVVVNDMYDSPAKTNRYTGVVYLSPSFFDLPKDVQNFIICHEAGHIATKSSDEHGADQWAFNYYSKNGGSLKKAVQAMFEVLPMQTQEQKERALDQLKRALEYDAEVNGNQAAQEQLNKLFIPKKNASKMRIAHENALDRFLGLSMPNIPFLSGGSNNNNAANSQADLDRKNSITNILNSVANKKNAKASLLEDKGTAKIIRAEAKQTVADSKVLKFTPAEQQALPGMYVDEYGVLQQQMRTDAPADENSKTMLYVGIAVGLLVLVGIAFFMFKK